MKTVVVKLNTIKAQLKPGVMISLKPYDNFWTYYLLNKEEVLAAANKETGLTEPVMLLDFGRGYRRGLTDLDILYVDRRCTTFITSDELKAGQLYIYETG